MFNDYSQTGEQEFIECFFQGYQGSYLDIGAFDGVKMSNTLRLSELGWNGTLLEASPVTFKKLQKNYQERNIKNCEIINKALVPNYWCKDLNFYESYIIEKNGKDTIGLGTFSKEHLIKYPWINHVESIPVNYIKILDFFNLYGYEYNFISIDVEELNFELVLDIPWANFTKLKLICIEADVESYRFHNFFEHFNFKFIAQRGANIFYTKFPVVYSNSLNIE